MAFVSERFEAKVSFPDDPWECWEWTAGKISTGYGAYHPKKGTLVLAHRLSFEWTSGSPIPKGMVIRHGCDNPLCVNPLHLDVGTYGQNTRDACNRGRIATKANGKHFSVTQPHRIARGERNGHSKLTSNQVLEIRRLRMDGQKQADLAKAFGVSQQTISRVTLAVDWKEETITDGRESLGI
jgi:hypothetical protein